MVNYICLHLLKIFQNVQAVDFYTHGFPFLLLIISLKKILTITQVQWLVQGNGCIIMNPISISQDHIWRSSMTSASVALHESNPSFHADSLVLWWVWVHHGKVMRHRKPDERQITCACAKAGRLHGAAILRPAEPSQQYQLLRLAEADVSAQPLASLPLSPEAADSRHKRNCPQPLTLAGPSKHCVLVICHLFLFSGLTIVQDRALQFCMRHKR